MREIKFQGLTKTTREWVYGSLMITPSGDVYIFPTCATDSFDRYEVYSDTVGQYTGFKDAYEVEIYEGNIVKSNNGDDDDEYVDRVEFLNGCWQLVSTESSNVTNLALYGMDPSNIQVIGNIHEHKHLLS